MIFTKWEDLSEVEQLRSEYSDFHKSVHGCRAYLPVDVTVEAARDAMARLEKVAEVVYAEEADAEAAAVARFEARVASVIDSGAGDRATALRWIFDAEDEYSRADKDYFCYNNGLPYGYFREAA